MSGAGRVFRFKLGKSPRDVDRALRYVVRTAGRHVAVYREAWEKAGSVPSGIGGRSDLARLSTISKAHMLNAYPVGVVRHGVDPARCDRRFTSGSTGVPFAVLYSRSERWFRKAALLRTFSRYTRLPWPLRVAEVGTGPNQAAQLERSSGKARFRRPASLRPFTIERVSRLDPVERQAVQLSAAQAHVVTGHPSLLELIAEVLLRADTEWKRPRLVVSRGEVLTPHARDLFALTFRCPVVDFYNCEEIGNIAWQCPRRAETMHVNHDLCWLEAVGDDGEVVHDGTAGRVVVTSLYNTTMPFVRYVLDDRVAVTDRGRCECGYRGTTVSLVQGRAQDFIVLPGGERISPRVVDSLVSMAIMGGPANADRLPSSGLVRYQIVQEAPETFTVRVLARTSAVAVQPSAIQAALAELHPEIRCRVEFVEVLPLEPSGKRRAIISRVSGGTP